MSTRSLAQIVRDGVADGVLPAEASPAAPNDRPWPVLMLTGLGAWLSAVPLVLFFSALFGKLLERGPTPYILGLALLAGAIVVLRSKTMSLFMEQLAVPALLAGAVLLGIGLYGDMRSTDFTAVLALVAALVAWIVPRAWLRVLLGVAIALLLSIAISFHSSGNRGWLAWHIIAAIWIGTYAIERWMLARGRQIDHAAALEAVSVGIAIAALGGLALSSGSTFLVGGLFDRGSFGSAGASAGPSGVMQLTSVGLTLAAAAWLPVHWPALRTWWYAAVAILIAILAWFSVTLGAALLVLALCLTSGRLGIAIFAAVAALWMIGGFYYQLQWPLATKAVVLAGAGTLMGLLVGFAVPGRASSAAATPSPGPARGKGTGPAAIMFCGALVLVVANAGIWQKESLINNGVPVFVELAPADPRSLMQGDFMRLNFALPDVPPAAEAKRGGAPRVVVRRDKRGVASVVRMHDGSTVRPGELVIELVQKEHRWILVTDAWFFAEGEADRWAKAKYGEFRVDGHGRALLVGLRGPQLEKL
jgi:uncharacterized membrane-anchored protein